MYLFDKHSQKLSYPDLRMKCRVIPASHPELAKNVEVRRRDQAQSKLWFQKRSGRVTVSQLKTAVVTVITQPSQSLIKAVCYPESKSNATTWGCKHEETARTEYESITARTYINFSVSQSGLVILPSYPFMGASPDGMVNCKCCGA